MTAAIRAANARQLQPLCISVALGAHGLHFPGRVDRDHGLEEARRNLALGLECFGLSEEALQMSKKGDARKGVIAAMIRTRTTAPNAWIVEALKLGHISRVSHCVRMAKQSLELQSTLEAYVER